LICDAGIDVIDVSAGFAEPGLLVSAFATTRKTRLPSALDFMATVMAKFGKRILF
jgi:hypothetical protein